MDEIGEGHAEDLALPDCIATKRALGIVGVPLNAERKSSGGEPLVAMATPTIFR